MVNASLCTVEVCMHLGDVFGGLLISQELVVRCIDIISMLNWNMKHASHRLVLLNFKRQIF